MACCGQRTFWTFGRDWRVGARKDQNCFSLAQSIESSGGADDSEAGRESAATHSAKHAVRRDRKLCDVPIKRPDGLKLCLIQGKRKNGGYALCLTLSKRARKRGHLYDSLAYPMKLHVALAAASFILASTSYSAQVSFSATAPSVGPNDIASLSGAAAVGNNVSSGDPNATYLADDRHCCPK